MKSFCRSCVLFFIANITVIFVALFIDYLFGQEAGALTAGIGLLLLWIYFLYLIIRFLKRLCNLKKSYKSKSHQIEQLEKQTSCVIKKEPHVSNQRSTQKQNRLSPSSMKKRKILSSFYMKITTEILRIGKLK
ncbi:hypothetical protein CEP48_05090 [Mergibacter septicus]|uniref:Uncharacterized protein n=1 Tax=Mergibacter septicus TaxID=221402 RepID=A0A8D4J2D7_9PAST|nr:hypothetical protein [Mergibacter septicus]AWX15585.1 hypothetical protein CEP47_05090 [Mergibacter septicus]QDJ14839.1 hypothetical protein CEP48_05090 [Mergibacter septicus]UTU47733.1 hypothetical protein HLL31_02495 [Mergibacter septicus]WMR96661.1 hypothetical protein RDJ12_03640 [Mergibacter septicus]